MDPDFPRCKKSTTLAPFPLAADFAVYPVQIDYDIPPAEFTPTFQSLDERVAAAIASLDEVGALPTAAEIDDEARRTARAIFSGDETASDYQLSDPPVVAHLAALLDEYDKKVVQSAQQIRTYVTNKLIMESANPDARIRIKALEMLGKMSDVGLFTEKTEVTLRHRPTEELEQLLRERLTKVIEGGVSEPNPYAERAVPAAPIEDAPYRLPGEEDAPE